MANGLKLSDGRLINADFIVLVSHLVIDEDTASFNIEFSNSTKILISGNQSTVMRDHTEVRRAIGIVDPNLIR